MAKVSEDTFPSQEPVTVIRDRRIRAAGVRQGDVVAYQWGFEQEGLHHIQRSFVLLDDGVQINQPVIFPEEQQGWWYCDLVTVVDAGDSLQVNDMWIDAIVGPPDHPYRVLDLDEYAEAMAAGALSVVDGVDGLIRWQRFLDRRLNRRHDVTRTWPDFPPAAVEALLTVDLPLDWTLLDPPAGLRTGPETEGKISNKSSMPGRGTA